jgi:hypothetical protein
LLVIGARTGQSVAMTAEIATYPWSLTDLAELLD